MFKTKKRGVLLIDADGEEKEPVACYLIPERKPEDSEYSKSLTYDVSILTDEEDRRKKCEILVKSNDKGRLKDAMDNFERLFKNIGDIGNTGHSYEIKYVPNSNQGKIDTVGWDGDGSDYIDTKSIKIK